MNKDYTRISVIAPYIDGLLAEKRTLGYSYVFEEYVLNVFDHFCNEHGLQEPCFNREFLLGWLEKWGDESSSYHSQRISFIRQLALYMNSLGIRAYIPVESVKKEITIPHFLSKEERVVFFETLDQLEPRISRSAAWRAWNEYRVMFRLLYSCGMRNNEVCSLRTADVDLVGGILTIYHAKGHKDRLVYLADDMRQLMSEYRSYITCRLGSMPVWFFPARDPKLHIHKATLDAWFNRVWRQTPYANTCTRKPTVHCLRHSFVVDRMNAWLIEGRSYDQMLPYLSKYLGHSGLEESMYYYHLNEEANIFIRQIDRTAGRVIPGVEKYAK